MCHAWEGSQQTNQTAARDKTKSNKALPASIGHPAAALAFAGSRLICWALQRSSDAVGDYEKGIASAPCAWDSGWWRQHDTERLGLVVLPARMASKATMLRG